MNKQLIAKAVTVVATASLDYSINLTDISSYFKGIAYDPKKCRCAYFRSSKIYGTVSIFPSGRLINIGAKSENDAKGNLIYVAKALGKKGFGRLARNP